MPRRSNQNRVPLAVSIVIGLLALSCFLAAPALAADENEPVTTLTTVMHNFDTTTAQKFSLYTRDGQFIWGGWVNLGRRNGYVSFFPGTEYAERVIITPYVTYTKKYGSRCWKRKRERFSYGSSDSLANVDMNTVVRKGENQLLFQETRDGELTQVTVTYDLVTLLPSRFEIASVNTQSDEKIDLIQTVSYATPTRPPKPGRICKSKKRR